MKYIYYYKTDIGEIGIVENGAAIINIHFGRQQIDKYEYESKETALIKNAAKQLFGYFNGNLKEFNLPLAPKGTEFQLKVWDALRRVPYGETRSYGEIAGEINQPKASRAVGMANNKNPIPIIIPCHRIIGANGKLVGYAGGLELKSYLLSIEKLNIK